MILPVLAWIAEFCNLYCINKTRPFEFGMQSIVIFVTCMPDGSKIILIHTLSVWLNFYQIGCLFGIYHTELGTTKHPSTSYVKRP